MSNDESHSLSLTRTFDATPEAVYKAWTQPELLKQWFAPKPYTTPGAELDVRPGGANKITMRSPEGQDMPNEGVYLEVIPNKKLVFTDAFKGGWIPAGPFMVVTIEMEPLAGGKTKYTATVRHWTAEAKEQHEKMGFHEGWGQCADQLGELVKTIA